MRKTPTKMNKHVKNHNITGTKCVKIWTNVNFYKSVNISNDKIICSDTVAIIERLGKLTLNIKVFDNDEPTTTARGWFYL